MRPLNPPQGDLLGFPLRGNREGGGVEMKAINNYNEEVIMGIQEIMKDVERKFLTENKEEFRTGDTVSLSLRIVEGDKERLQPFQGVVIQHRGSGLGKSFTVRKASGNVYVERTFPLHSPMISDLKVVRRGSVRRAKLFYLRGVSGKSTRIKEKK
jgi:large subunit ribosomal protein L19